MHRLFDNNTQILNLPAAGARFRVAVAYSGGSSSRYPNWISSGSATGDPLWLMLALL
jgi:hypothetical protein